MINEFQLSELLDEPESETLDFKQECHSSNIDLLHDILCMANTYAEKDRMLVLGVVDKTREIVGVENDSNFKNQAQIYDLLRQSNFNRIPTIHLQEFTIADHKVVILIIANRPDKPFFLTKDKTYQDKMIRAGVIYTRLGDTNTPLKEAAPDDKVELMWRERFGIGLSPLERFQKLLDEPDKWVNRPGRLDCFHHQQFPEFTIQHDGENNEEREFQEDWCEEKFPDPHCYKYEYELKYHSTVLDSVLIISCDGGRFMLPLPEIKTIENSLDDEDVTRQFFILKNSIRYKVARLFRQYYSLDQTLSTRCGIELIDE